MINTISKKIYFLVIVLLLTVGIAAYVRNSNGGSASSDSVWDTGKILDITDKNNKVVFADLGDSLFISLVGEDDDSYQWTFREPIAGGFISLKKHKNTIKGDSIFSDWTLKVEKKDSFNLRFDYENPILTEIPQDTFRVKVVSVLEEEGIDNILVDSPQNNKVAPDTIFLSGYARVFEGSVNYRLKTDDGVVIARGFVQAAFGDGSFGFFEETIEYTKPDSALGIFEVFQISAKDGIEIDKIILKVLFDSDILDK